jgi:type IV pilus assembly protein PilC
MPQYRYTALSQNGSLVTGESAASSSDALKTELEALGLRIQHIRVKHGFLQFWLRSAVRPEDFLLFVQEFMALVRAGLPLPEVLALAADRPAAPVLSQVLDKVLKEVRSGVQFSQACANHPDVFDSLFLAALRTGEKTGELPSVLARYLEYLRRRVALRKKVSQALAYPVFLLIALATILFVLFLFVMPRFVAMYANFDARLPTPTLWLMAGVDHFPLIAIAVVLLGALGWYGWRSYVAAPEGRLKIDRLKLHMPLFGATERTATIAHFARSLSTLLAGGTPLLEALRIVQESFPNRACALQVAEVAGHVTQGESFARAARAAGLLPETAIKMVQVGEASGALDEMLAEVAQFYEDTLESGLARLMALIEPALVLLMGLMIGGIIIVMYLPIFSLAEVVR